MHTQTITLWNFHRESGMWYPTVIEGVSCWANGAASASLHGGNSATSFEASIPCTSGGTIISKGGEKRIFPPKTYAVCASPDKCVTFSPGVDFIAEGEPESAMPIRDADYESGFYDAMNNANDGVHLLVSSAYYRLIPHYEIGGK